MQHHFEDYDGYMTTDAETIVDFVNTLDVSTGDDALADLAGFRSWLADTSVTERDRRNAVELRERLRRTLLAHHDGVDDPESLEAISALTDGYRLALRFVDGTAELASRRPGFDTFVASVANAIMRLQHDRQWLRVRICPTSDCLEAFHDQSRGGTRRWCSMEECGNRSKVGRYRTRTRPASG